MITLLVLGLLVLMLVLGFSVPVALGAAVLLAGAFGVPVMQSLPITITNLTTDYVMVAIAMFVFYGRLSAEVAVRARLAGTVAAMLGGSSAAVKIGEVLSSLFQPDSGGDALLLRNDEAAATVNRLRLAGIPGMAALGFAAGVAFFRMFTPPGVLLVAIGILFQVSIGHLFVVIMPIPIVIAVLLVLVSLTFGRSAKNPAHNRAAFDGRSLTWICVPMVVFSLIFLGIATPMEAGAVAVAIALIVGLAQGELSIRRILRASFDTVQDTGAIVLVLVFAQALHFVFAYDGTNLSLNSWLNTTPALAIAAAIGIAIVGSAVVGPLPTLFVAGPLFLPLMQHLGFGQIYFSIVFAMAVSLGQLIPPVGSVFATLAAGTTERPGTVAAGVGIYALVCAAVLALLMLVPRLVTWDPF